MHFLKILNKTRVKKATGRQILPRGSLMIKKIFLVLVVYFFVFLDKAQAATIIVNSFDDLEVRIGSPCSFREAVQTANTNTDSFGCVRTGDVSNPADLIVLNNGTHLLSPSGHLDPVVITEDLIIEGPATGETIIDGTDLSSSTPVAIEITSGDVILRQVKIQNARSVDPSIRGGAIVHRSSGRLTLERVVISDNVSGSSQSAGLYSQEGSGPVIIQSSTFRNNRNLNNDTSTYGGAIYKLSASQLLVEDSIIENNNSDTLGFPPLLSMGGGIASVGGELIIRRTQIRNNKVGDKGGGIYALDSNVIVENSTISNNDSSLVSTSLPNAGGGIYLESSTGLHTARIVSTNITNNRGVLGGGIYNNGFSLTVTGLSTARSLFENNNRNTDGTPYCRDSLFRCSGSAIYNNDGDMLIENTDVIGNRSMAGGGGFTNIGGRLEIRNLLFRDNQSLNTVSTAPGGALLNDVPTHDDLVIADTRFTLNSAVGSGGAIYNNRSPMSLRNSIIDNNRISSSLTDDFDKEVTSINYIIRIESSNFINNPNGALYQGCGLGQSLEVYKSLFDHNTHTREAGGGIYQYGSDCRLLVVNSTVSHNTAFLGGGIYTQSRNGFIINTTFNLNTPQQIATAPDSRIVLGNNLFNSPGRLVNDCIGGGVITAGHNISNVSYFGAPGVSTNPCFFNFSEPYFDQSDVLPLISETLSGVAGSVAQVYALQTGSPAINSGDACFCRSAEGIAIGLSQDQLNQSRDMRCDVGAYEAVGVPIVGEGSCNVSGFGNPAGTGGGSGSGGFSATGGSSGSGGDLGASGSGGLSEGAGGIAGSGGASGSGGMSATGGVSGSGGASEEGSGGDLGAPEGAGGGISGSEGSGGSGATPTPGSGDMSSNGSSGGCSLAAVL